MCINEIWLNNKEKQTTDIYKNMHESQKYVEQKKLKK